MSLHSFSISCLRPSRQACSWGESTSTPSTSKIAPRKPIGSPFYLARAAAGDPHAAELRLYLLQGFPFGLWHPEVDEEPRHDAQRREQPERAGPPERCQQDGERQGDEPVRAPVRQGGHAHGLAADVQRVDLRDHQPEYRSEAYRERGYVQPQTHGRQHARRAPGTPGCEDHAQEGEAHDHADEPDDEQRPAPRPVDDPDGEDREPDVHHAHAEGGGRDGAPLGEADALEYRGRVVDHGVDAGYLLEDGQPKTYYQGGHYVRRKKLRVAHSDRKSTRLNSS